MRTTIQISDDLRKRLKIMASEQDISYEQALEQMSQVFEASMPFRNEKEFAQYFEANLSQFGFKKILEKRPKGYPDYRVLTEKNEEKEVELELVGESFTHHKRDPKKVDYIACIFSNQKNIQEIPVLSLLEPPTEKGEFIKYKKANYTTISLPTELADKAKKQIEGTGFKNLSDFVTFLVREVASTKDKWDENKSMDQITKKLKALGYID